MSELGGQKRKSARLSALEAAKRNKKRKTNSPVNTSPENNDARSETEQRPDREDAAENAAGSSTDGQASYSGQGQEPFPERRKGQKRQRLDEVVGTSSAGPSTQQLQTQVMLYVDMEVNGVPLKAFVDSGAQSMIISKSCVEHCGLLRLLDQLYKGIAHGVGQSEILDWKQFLSLFILGTGFAQYGIPFWLGHAPRCLQCTIDLKDEERRLKEASSSGAQLWLPFRGLKLFNGNEEQAASCLFGGRR